MMLLLRKAKRCGLSPLLAGNMKGFLDSERNETGAEPWAAKLGQKVEKMIFFTDNSKLCMENASFANAAGWLLTIKKIHSVVSITGGT